MNAASAATKRYRQRHPKRWRESHRKTQLKWRWKNIISFRKKRRAYRRANAARCYQSVKKWRKEHPLSVRKLAQRYAKKHSDVVNAKTARHRARKRSAVQGDKGLIQKIYRRCQQLRKWFDVEVDHIIPLFKGGAHSSENLQIIYAIENARKGARLDYTPSVIFV